ncbi:facilitated trehalose transporter Tret1-2 homolog [Diabrotica virgifera virgifera]|uniref:Major facilitator superfamily (MFS) profile domain-containing protein n=1 Tax=Diabrotica virgifera virgifera TaxID=50390 RepID=A0ABM5IM07_DIAVI|nr:facilitated trehalose transporter Tret1-2 homolog [Diabrotica virgifera virgifera]
MVDSLDSNSRNNTLEELVNNSNRAPVDYTVQDARKKPDTAFLYFSTLTANLLLFSCSNFHVWTSPTLPKLLSNDTLINPVGRPINTLEVSLLAGFPFFVGLMGSIFSGTIADTVGRKSVMLYAAITVIMCSVTISASKDIYVYIVARCIIFVCYSSALVLVPLYLTEVCEDHNRAKFGCLMGISMPAGHLYSYVTGAKTSLPVYTLLCAAPLVLFLIAVLLFVPETPVYLIAKGKIKIALKVLEKLRRNKQQQEIERDFEKINDNYKTKRNSVTVSVVVLLKSKVNRKAIILAILPMWVQHLSGVTVIMQFMVPIFDEAGTNLSGTTVSVIAGTIKIIMFIITALFVEKTGRRPLLLLSGYGTGVSLFLLGLFLYWNHIKWQFLSHVVWLPILCLLLNLIVYSIGLGPIPMAVMSELFDSKFRPVALSFLVTLNGILVSALNFLFPILERNFGTHCCMWLFSICCFGGTTLIYFYLPETKGKSISEIQKLLNK